MIDNEIFNIIEEMIKLAGTEHYGIDNIILNYVNDYEEIYECEFSYIIIGKNEKDRKVASFNFKKRNILDILRSRRLNKLIEE